MKRFVAIILSLFLLFLPGCGPPPARQAARGEPYSFTDALGHSVAVSSSQRVIAASGSFAGAWLLAGGVLAGTTRDALGEIADLGDTVADIGNLQSPSMEKIIALNPDLLILSANISAHVKLYDELNAAGITTAYFDVELFADYLAMLKILTDLTGRPDLYEQNGAGIQAKIDAAIANAKGRPPLKILLLRSNSTEVKARDSSTMAGAMLKDLGCVNIADRESGLLNTLSMEVIIQEDPDFIFIILQGESEEKALGIVEESLKSNPAWAGLTAVKNERYFILPKDLFHLKPNERWAESYEYLSELLYGE